MIRRLVLTLWYAFRGHPCPHCGASPGQRHMGGCQTGEWDGGTWG